MKIKIFPDADAVAQKAAEIIAAAARAAVKARGRFIVAVSGGHTPWQMLRALADEEVPWKDTHVVQVDERIAPAGDPDRNLTHLYESLLEHAPLRRERIYAMPVEVTGTRKRGRTVYRYSPGDRRITARARPCPSRSRSRRPHRLACTGRSGSERHRFGSCADWNLPGEAPDDVDVSDS